MSISKNFPSIVPSLNLNFARSQDLDPRITFTRGSSATYVDDTGLIRTAGTNQARFDHDPVTLESLGLLIEESRTNLVLQSTSPDNLVSPWSKGPNTTRIGTTTSPDGTNNAINYSGDGSGGNEFINQTVSLAANTTYTASLWAKLISGASPTSGAIISAEYNNGTSNVRATVAYSGNLTTSWKRFSVTFTNVNSGSYSFFINTDQNTTAQIAIWGAQLEAGSFATSFISTSGSTVTRSADSASITGTNFSGFYNNNEGSVIANFKFYANHPPYYDAVSVSGGGGGFMVNNVVGGLVTDCYGGGTAVTGGDNVRNKFATGVRAYKFSTNDSVIGCSGENSITTQTGTITNPNTTALWLGRRGDGGSTYIMNGNIKQVLYYPVRLSNTQLLTFTKQS